jgi:hypothetical protein
VWHKNDQNATRSKVVGQKLLREIRKKKFVKSVCLIKKYFAGLLCANPIKKSMPVSQSMAN